MDRVIYVKYNSLRAPEYRITTEIHEDENRKWVVKRPGSDAAKAHLYRIASNRELLEQRTYKNISVLDATVKGEQLWFPFVAGKTFAETITYSKGDEESFCQCVNQALDRIFDVREECRCIFKPTDALIACFGEIYPEEGVPAICPANLDSLFSNFIEADGKLINLDYEWVFDFPIPVDFLKYRSIRYFYNERQNSMFDGISRDTVLNWFGYDQKKQDLFWSMESHFHQRVYGENWKYLYLDRYKKGEITIQSLYDNIANQERIVQEKENRINGLENEILIREDKIRELDHEILSREDRIKELFHEIQNQEMQKQGWEKLYQELTNSTSWRMTEPFRKIAAYLRRNRRD